MTAEFHTKVSGDVYQQIQSLRLEGDARTALCSTELAAIKLQKGRHQGRQRTLSCTILRSKMRILAKCEKSAVPPALAHCCPSRLVAIDIVEEHHRHYQLTRDAKDV
jgi:hypothetical protein